MMGFVDDQTPQAAEDEMTPCTDSAPVAVAQLDPSGTTIQSADGCFLAMLGLDGNALPGVTLASLFHHKGGALLVGGNGSDELQLSSPRAEAEWVRLTITRFDGKCIAVCEDISEQKAVESQRIHSDRLAQLGGLAATLVHDLSQPLNIIRLTAENALARAEMGDADPKRMTDGFQTVVDQIVRMQDGLHGIVEAALPAQSPQRLFDPRPLVEKAIEATGRLPVAARIRLLAEPSETPLSIHGDPARFQRLLCCLLLNSCEAILKAAGASARGRDNLGSVVVFSRLDEERGLAIVTIADSGPGVAQEVLDRVHNPVLGKAGGKGLGLPMALGLAAEMGGSVEVTNTGRGARFDLLLPAEI